MKNRYDIKKTVTVIMAVIMLVVGIVPATFGTAAGFAGMAYAEELAVDTALGEEIEADTGKGTIEEENTDTAIAEETEPDTVATDEKEPEAATTEENKTETVLAEESELDMASDEGIEAFGDNESFRSVAGGVSPYNVDTTWIHYRSDGALAYCRQKGIANPDGTQGNYWINAWEPGESSKITGLFASVDSIASSYGISGDYKRALIQMAIWTVEHEYDSLNPSIGSISSSNSTMLAALHALYNAAQAGYTQQTASISGLSNGQYLSGAVSGSYVRYGPFSVSGSASASASASGAPSGSFFGDASGNPINAGNISNGQAFYYYIPFGDGWTTTPTITIKAKYQVVTVSKYSGFYGYQDQIVWEEHSSSTGEISAKGSLYGFGKATLWKHDDEDGAAALSGAVFVIDRWSKSSNSWKDSGVSVTWNSGKRRYETGVLIETADNEGRFRIRETKAPYSYLSGWSEEINIHRQYGTTFVIHAENKPVKLAINFVKNDRNTGTNIPQGDASLAGAVYGLFMNEDREHPNGTKFKKGQKIAEAVTDKDGRIVFEDLFPAKYYIKELSPSEGYLLDETVYEIDGTHDGVEKSVVRNAIATEQVMKQGFELIKIGTSEAETEVSLLNAGFKVYLISELSRVADGSLNPTNVEWSYRDFKDYDFSDENTAMIDGVNTPEFFTDNLGHFVSPEFPYGNYVVIESTTPEGYMSIDPFIVAITGDSRVPQPWRIFDDKETKYFIRIIKKDAETGNTVLNKSAKYRIYDMDKGEYIKMKTTYPAPVWHGTKDNPFTTDETGALITPEKLKYGYYRLDEVSAPDGFVLAGNEQTAQDGYNPDGHTAANPANPVYIQFDGNTPVYCPDADDVVLEVVQYNEQQRGRIYISKHGDKPDAVSMDKNGNAVYRYTDEPLGGVVFCILADGDVVSQDCSGTVLYRGGEVVETLVTDENGHAWSGDLYIGNYILREAEAPEGYIPVKDERFSITPIEQTKQYTFLTWDLTDKRQLLNIEIIKTEKGTGKLLAGAEFTLYAATDIQFGVIKEESGNAIVRFFGSIKTAVSGERVNIIKKDEAIAKAITGKDGKAVFADLPPGRYYVKETKAPKGYQINKSFKVEFELAYDRSGSDILVWKATCKDDKIPTTPTTPAPNQPTTLLAKGHVPKTGDGFDPIMWIAIAAAAAAAIIIVLDLRKKKSKADEADTESK